MLIDVVSKGGNLILGVGPTPAGTITKEETSILEEIGEWLQRYGEGIYHTRPLEKKQSDNTEGWYFTSHKEKNTYYAFRSILEIPQSVIKLSEIKASIDTVVVDLATEKQLSFYEIDG